LGKGAKMRVVSVDGEARKALKRYLNLRPRGVRRLGNPYLTGKSR